MNNTLVRTVTGIFIILLIILPIWAVSHSFIYFSLIFSLITFFSLREFYSIVSCSGQATPLIHYNALTGALFFMVTSLVMFKGFSYIFFLLIWLMLLVAMIAELYRKKKDPLKNIAFGFYGLLWIALPLAALNILFWPGFYEGDVHIPAMAVFVFLWVNDTGAYVFGLGFGKHRLFERISPKKSWEGFIGGILSVVAAAYVVSFFWLGFSFLNWLLFGLTIAISGTFGDLKESLFKRIFQCKDSGRFFPGHGGFLDRFDCVFFAVPFALIFLFVKKYLGL